MLDRVKFMETLRSVAEIARGTGQTLSREEINKYFENELSEEQQEMVFQYLKTAGTQEEVQPEETEENPEAQTGDTADSDTLERLVNGDSKGQSSTDASKAEQPEQEAEISAFLQMYLEDIEELPQITKDEAQALYMQLIEGDSMVTQSISDYWIPQVVEIAKSYSKHRVNLEDLIQEGNMGLLGGMQNLLGTRQTIDVEEYLLESVKKSIEDFIDEEMTDDEWVETVIAKATLIYEAQKALAEDLGRMPSNNELCNYTKLSSEEVSDIIKLWKTN